jgi:hypothetical protein
MGNIRENGSHQFTIYPEGHALETMADIQRGPPASLDAALAEIERHTRGALDVESVLDGGVGGENLSARSRVQR